MPTCPPGLTAHHRRALSRIDNSGDTHAARAAAGDQGLFDKINDKSTTESSSPPSGPFSHQAAVPRFSRAPCSGRQLSFCLSSVSLVIFLQPAQLPGSADGIACAQRRPPRAVYLDASITMPLDCVLCPVL